MLDNKFHQEGRKVVMIIDNSPAHPHIGIDNLKVMTIVYLSNNTISITQVMNQSVIQSLKAKCHKIPKYKFCSSHHSSFRYNKAFPTFLPCICLQEPGTKHRLPQL